MTPLAKPGLGQAVTDPEFGTTIRRITNVGVGEVIKPVYSTMPAWNADESYMILWHRTDQGHHLYDGKTYAYIRKLNINATDLEQVVWHPTDPDVFFYPESRYSAGWIERLVRYHISTDVKETVRDFTLDGVSGYNFGFGADPLYCSWDGTIFGLIATESDLMFAYDVSQNKLGTIKSVPLYTTHPAPAPSGTLFFWRGNVLDFNMNTLRSLDLASHQEHASLGKLANGRDMYFAVAFDPGPGGSDIGTLVAHDMTDATSRVIIGPVNGYPYPPSSTHISALTFQHPGLVCVSVMGFAKDGQTLLDNELLLANANPGGRVYRAAHLRTKGKDGPLGYWAEAHASTSPSGTRIVFASDWEGLNEVNTYVVELHSYSSTPIDTNDNTAPLTQNIMVDSITHSSAVVSWTNNEMSTGRVEYGLTVSYGSVRYDWNRGTTHSVKISGMAAETKYHFKIVAKDDAGNESSTPDQALTTGSIPVPPAATGNDVVETFASAKSLNDGSLLGACNLLTLETAGSPQLVAGNGSLFASSPAKADGFIIRSSQSLPATYKTSVDIGFINFDLINAADEENGVYFISVTDSAGQPTTNDWWHSHRKVMLDTDNNTWGSGGSHPIFFGYYIPGGDDYFYNGSVWGTSWQSAMNYATETWYTFEMEKTSAQYFYRVYDAFSHALLSQASVNISSVKNGSGPDYLAIGDPHTNYYNGDIRITNIRITNTGCVSTALTQGEILKDFSAYPSAQIKVSPNPFSNSVNIEFRLSPSAAVFNIFSLKGEKIKSFKVPSASGKTVQFQWNGSNESQGLAPAGVYLGYLEDQAGRRQRGVKLIYLK